jgi:hypothetical protein
MGVILWELSMKSSLAPMKEKNRLLVTDEPVEFKK